MWYTNIYSKIKLYQKYLGTSIQVACTTRSLYASSGPKAEGVPTNNQRGLPITVGKIMTFDLQPLLRFLEIVKDWNAAESFAFEGVIVWSMPTKSKWKSSILRPIYLCSPYIKINEQFQLSNALQEITNDTCRTEKIVSNIIFFHLQVVLPKVSYVKSISVFGTNNGSVVETIEAKGSTGTWKTILTNRVPSTTSGGFTKAIEVRCNL